MFKILLVTLATLATGSLFQICFDNQCLDCPNPPISFKSPYCANLITNFGNFWANLTDCKYDLLNFTICPYPHCYQCSHLSVHLPADGKCYNGLKAIC